LEKILKELRLIGRAITIRAKSRAIAIRALRLSSNQSKTIQENLPLSLGFKVIKH